MPLNTKSTKKKVYKVNTQYGMNVILNVLKRHNISSYCDVVATLCFYWIGTL